MQVWNVHTCISTPFPKISFYFAPLFPVSSRTDWLHIYKDQCVMFTNILCKSHIKSGVSPGRKMWNERCRSRWGWGAHPSAGAGSALCSISRARLSRAAHCLSFSIACNESVFMWRSVIKADKQNQEFQNIPCFPFRSVRAWSSCQIWALKIMKKLWSPLLHSSLSVFYIII